MQRVSPWKSLAFLKVWPFEKSSAAHNAANPAKSPAQHTPQPAPRKVQRSTRRSQPRCRRRRKRNLEEGDAEMRSRDPYLRGRERLPLDHAWRLCGFWLLAAAGFCGEDKKRELAEERSRRAPKPQPQADRICCPFLEQGLLMPLPGSSAV